MWVQNIVFFCFFFNSNFLSACRTPTGATMVSSSLSPTLAPSLAWRSQPLTPHTCSASATTGLCAAWMCRRPRSSTWDSDFYFYFYYFFALHGLWDGTEQTRWAELLLFLRRCGCCRCMSRKAWKHLTSCLNAARRSWSAPGSVRLPWWTGAHQGNPVVINTLYTHTYIYSSVNILLSASVQELTPVPTHHAVQGRALRARPPFREALLCRGRRPVNAPGSCFSLVFFCFSDFTSWL